MFQVQYRARFVKLRKYRRTDENFQSSASHEPLVENVVRSLFYVRFYRQSIKRLLIAVTLSLRQPIKRSTKERLARLPITTTNPCITTFIYYIIMFQRILLIALLAIVAISSTEVCGFNRLA